MLEALFGEHDPTLVVVSYLVSVVGSWAGLELAGQMRQETSRHPLSWLANGAVAIGGVAIWCMHFVAMLAYEAPVPVTYGIPLTALSLLIAVAVVAVGLYMVSRDTRPTNVVYAGTLVGCGVAAMHYTGMAAMIVPAEMVYDGWLVALSVGVAIAASSAALWLAFHLEKFLHRAVAALVMAVAVAGMHYTGMAALTLEPVRGTSGPAVTGMSPDLLAISIVGVAVSFLTASYLFYLSDRLAPDA